MRVGDVIRRSWEITRRYKFLWLLAFLAGVVTFDPSDFSGGSPTMEVAESTGAFEEFSALDNLSPAGISALVAAFIGIIIVALFVGLLLWLLGKVAAAGLIHATAHLDDGRQVTLGESFRVGYRMLGRMVGTSLLLYAPLILLFFILFLAIIIAGFAGETAGALGATGGFIALMCFFVLYILAANLVQPFAERGIVLQDLGVVDGIRHGWSILISNFGSILGLGFILFLLAIPIYFVVAIFDRFGGIPFLPVLFTIAVNAAYGTLFSSSFTIAYKGFTSWEWPKDPLDQLPKPVDTGTGPTKIPESQTDAEGNAQDLVK